MMRLFSFLLLIFVFLLSSCKTEEPHIIQADKILNNFSSHLSKKGAFPFGPGGSFMDRINKFSMDFIYPTESMDLDRARILAIQSAEEFFKIVNKDKEARPYLKKFPFDQNDLYLFIIFEKTNGNYLDGLTGVTVSFNKLNYQNHTDDMGFEPFFTETYAEAYEKVYGVPLPDRTVQYGTRD